MAWSLTLRVGDTSAQDISLTASGVAVEDYPMQPPDVNQQALDNLGDGGGLSIPSWSNVTESIDLILSGTAAVIRDKVRAIERLLDLARQGSIGWLDDKVYLLVQFDQDTEPWRSQILAAKLEVPQLTDQIWRGHARVTIVLTRRYYWETSTVHSIEMTSGVTTTPTTGYVTVYNDDDTHATNRNWFQMAAAQVEGSIPAPLKLYIKNNSGGVRSTRAFYIGNYVWENPTAVDPVLAVADASGSTTSWTHDEEVDSYFWVMSQELNGSFRRQFGRILVMFSDMPASTTLLRAAVQYREPIPIIDLALGDQILAGTDRVVDLGALPIPPGSAYAGMEEFLYLTVKAKAATASGDTLAVDWVQIMPSGAGRYRMIKAIGASWGMAATDELIDDGPNQGVYTLVSGNPVPAFRPFYSPIHAWPNKINRLRLIVQGNTSIEAGQIWQVKAEYRARRLTV